MSDAILVGVQIRVLGPLELDCGHRAVAVSRRQERALLVLLALQARRPVSVDRLIDLLWDHEPPTGAREAVQTYVSRLRAVLSRAGEAATGLVWRSGAYILDVDPMCVDALRFELLVGQARRIDQPVERAAVLSEALGLWRGAPLIDVISDDVRHRLAAPLEYLRADAFDLRIRAELAAGRHEEILPELISAVQDDPLNERLVNSLIQALHRTGRTDQALNEFHRLRHELVESAGRDPGPEIAATHLAVLRAGHPKDGAPPARPTPAQLPPDVSPFVGRAEQLKALGDMAGVRAIATICGPGGLGKTALAVHFGHSIARSFPDGQLYINLHGFAPTPATTPSDALQVLLDGLGVARGDIPYSVSAQSALYRSLLARRRTLIILDNARDAEQVRPLLPGTAASMAVVTSRADLSGLTISDGARPVPLSTLNDREALALLSLGIGGERTSAEPEIADEVIRRCAGLPLALAIAAARVATQPQVSLAQATGSLRRGPTTIEALGGPDPATDVRTVFSWSYTSLSSRAARMFRLAGAYAGPHVSLTAAASAAAEPAPLAKLLLAQLQAAHLIATLAADRFIMHDLLREYAVQQSGTDDEAAVRTASRHRLFDHYRHSAYRASRRLYPEFHIPVPADPLPGVLIDDIGSDEEARRWFDDNHTIVVAMICNAADQGPDDAGIHLCRIINGYLDRAGHWPERITSGLAALRSANRAADVESMANLHIGLGFAYVSHSDPAPAEHHLRRAGELYHRLGDADGEARAHVGLTHVFDPQGRYAEAAAHAGKALHLYRTTGMLMGIARALNAAGWCRAQLGDYTEALAHCEEALGLMRQADDRHGEAATLDSLGYIHRRAGRHNAADDCYQAAISLYGDIGDDFHEAESLMNLANNEHEAGRHDLARTHADRAVAVIDRRAHPAAEAIRRMRPT